MRKIYKYALMFVTMLAVGFTSCISDDNLIDNRPIIDGLPAKVSLEFEVNEDKEITRAAQSEYYEYLVQNIYVMVFSNGARVQTDLSFFSPNDTSAPITNYRNKADQAGNTQSSGTVSFGAISGSNLTICAIANVGISNTSITRAEIGDEVPIDVTTLDAVKTYKELQDLSIRLSGANIFRGASFMMTGEVIANLAANQTTTVTIPLKRADSKITFNVKAVNPDTTKYSDFIFMPGKWRVVNAPLKSYILPRTINAGDTLDTLTEDLDAASAEEDFYTVTEASAPQFEVVGNNQGSFTFYMYENLKAPEALISETGNAGYALRELQQKNTPTETDVVVSGQQYINGDYVNAPKDATYVIITGELSYNYVEPYTDPETGITQDLQKWVMADVEYCIHLGHSGVANVNDYSTLRNHHYTYNVTVQGVNDLIVEVDNGDQPEVENRPGAEGDVVMSAQRVINVDGHYDRANIVLTDSEAEKLYFAVSTPWERGLDTNGFADINTTVRDYKWVKFLINKEVGVGEAKNNFAPYPGEDCYDGGATPTGTPHASGAYTNVDAVTLRDIRQLSNYLKDATNRNNAKSIDSMIYITAFIDEYIYYYDPTTDPVSTNPAGTTYRGVTDLTASDTTALKLWKKSVNQQDRMLHIVKAGDMNYSADGETSLSRSVVTIQQKPIISVYNHMAQSLNTAWGSEVVNETPKMVVKRTSYDNIDTTNAYTEAQTLTAGSGTTTWASVISASEQYGLLGNYNDPSYACALRNRDLDGDGTIDQNEVLWYLASIDQMTDMWIADPAMPADKKLYDENNPDGYYTKENYKYPASHYVTSTISNSSPYVYWAEEYGATSTHDQAIEWDQAPLSGGDAVVSLRCIRHFGLAYNDTSMPHDYITVSQPTSSSVDGTIDLKYINPAALRTAPDSGTALAYAHLDDVGENNRPYAGFFVDYDVQELEQANVMSWRQAYDGEVTGTDRVCPSGYRVPNQREMVLMSRAITNWTNGSLYVMFNGQYFSGVDASGTDNYLFGAFYYYSNGNQSRITRMRMVVESGTEVGSSSGTIAGVDPGWGGTKKYVRCVKDNPNAKQDGAEWGEGGEG